MKKKTQFKYQQLYDDMASKIRGGAYEGGILPAEEELCKNYHAGRNVVRQALELLAEDSLIIKERGCRTVVNSTLFENPLIKKKLIFLHQFIDVGDNPIYSTLLTEMIEVATQQGIKIEPVRLHQNHSPAYIEYTVKLIEEADGVFITLIKDIDTDDEIKRALEQKQCLLGLDNVLNSTCKRSIGTDNYLGGRLAARCLLDSGCSCPGILTCTPAFFDYSPMIERCLGFRDEFRMRGGSMSAEQFVLSVNSSDLYNIRPFVLKLLKDVPRLDSIFCITDMHAIAVFCVLRELGKRVPEDISLVGFDGVGFGKEIVPLTTVQQPIRKIAEKGFSLMTEMLLGKDIDFNVIKVPPSMQMGQTTHSIPS